MRREVFQLVIQYTLTHGPRHFLIALTRRRRRKKRYGWGKSSRRVANMTQPRRVKSSALNKQQPTTTASNKRNTNFKGAATNRFESNPIPPGSRLYKQEFLVYAHVFFILTNKNFYRCFFSVAQDQEFRRFREGRKFLCNQRVAQYWVAQWLVTSQCYYFIYWFTRPIAEKCLV